MSAIRLITIAALFTLGAAAPAIASPCLGKTPAAGAKLQGTVLHVEDGQRLCLANGPTPDQWTEVEVLGTLETVADAQVAKASLMTVAFAKKMNCVVTTVVDGHASARCAVDKKTVASLISHADPVQVASWISGSAPTVRMASAN